jgi:CRISPR-associated protein Cas2
MLVLITYDVETITPAGRKRLRKVARQCINFGQRVQNSVFECLIEPAQFADLKHHLETIIDKEKDSIRYYYLGNAWKNKIEHCGVNQNFDMEGPLLV